MAQHAVSSANAIHHHCIALRAAVGRSSYASGMAAKNKKTARRGASLRHFIQ
jgi:hypothetical protein